MDGGVITPVAAEERRTMSTDITLPAAPRPKYPDVLVQLTGMPDCGPDWIKKVADALDREVDQDAVLDFLDEALDAGSLNQLLIVILRTVDVV